MLPSRGADRMPNQQGDNDGNRGAETLMTRFPPGAGGHLQRVKDRPNGGKGVVTPSQPPTAAAYIRHLARETLAGPGALGVKPARSSATGSLLCDFVALDLDNLTVEQL